jgi:hypothetical protein
MTTSHSDWAFDCPLNNLSFGQVSVAILRECYKRGLTPNIFPLQGQVDIGSQTPDEKFNQWLGHCIAKAQKEHGRCHTAYKLWHIQGSLQTYSDTDSRLITFYECNDLQPAEVNILRNQEKVYVTNRYTQGIFKTFGIDAVHLPLGFDAHNFRVLEKRPDVEGAITTILLAKLENRKHTLRQLSLWAKRYGNQKEYRLNAAIVNPFIKIEHQQQMIAQALEGKQYWNISFLPFMATNAEYNSYLQSGRVVLACSGSEGFGLGEYHAAAMGAWPVALKAHSYVDHFTDENAVWIKPNGMTPVYDDIHFSRGQPFNQGSIFTFSDEDWYAGVEEAHKRARAGLNIKGLELQKQTYAQTVDILLKDIK